ncbi:MAG: HD domain-containing protein [Lachnospiraceae bacterium]|nr:HD domain-containing protein [Lachnospiraceae bacterium]
MIKKTEMNRVNEILVNDLFLQYMDLNRAAEADRRFCCHNITHFLHVSRIAYILDLEEQYGIAKELIYAAGLLHDIGRFRQYENGTPHEEASASLAPEILKQCHFTTEETDLIISAILSHRDSSIKENRNLNGLLYRADKMSRECFYCPVESECNWKEDRKVKRLQA